MVLSEVVKGEKKWCVKAHKKGVNDIVWCQSQQWLASCGLGRVILLWQISISTPVFTLEGHQASVQSLCMNEATNTLISLDTDRVLNIWDTRTLRLVQHINAETQHPEWPVTACAFDSNRRAQPHFCQIAFENQIPSALAACTARRKRSPRPFSRSS